MEHSKEGKKTPARRVIWSAIDVDIQMVTGEEAERLKER